MASESVFPQTAPQLLPILDDLRRREPIFHRHEFPTVMSPDYWEVGASGRCYTRALILETLAQHPPVDAADANWQATGFAIQALAPDTYLLTYILNQNPRLTRRSTIWRNTPEGWQILYHQGTITSEPSQTMPQS